MTKPEPDPTRCANCGAPIRGDGGRYISLCRRCATAKRWERYWQMKSAPPPPAAEREG